MGRQQTSGRASGKQHKKGIMRRDREVRIILAAVVLMLIVLSFSSIRLSRKKAEYARREAELLQEIANEEARAQEIDAYEEYIGTDEYIEQIARERLGLAYPNEILFRAEE